MAPPPWNDEPLTQAPCTRQSSSEHSQSGPPVLGGPLSPLPGPGSSSSSSSAMPTTSADAPADSNQAHRPAGQLGYCDSQPGRIDCTWNGRTILPCRLVGLLFEESATPRPPEPVQRGGPTHHHLPHWYKLTVSPEGGRWLGRPPRRSPKIAARQRREEGASTSFPRAAHTDTSSQAKKFKPL